jgi:hypothetical protein
VNEFRQGTLSRVALAALAAWVTPSNAPALSIKLATKKGRICDGEIERQL